MARGPSVTSEEIDSLRAKFTEIPDEYEELSRDASEIELDFDGKYLRIWHPQTSKEMDEGYGISTRLPGAIAIGDDGGGRVLLYFNGKNGPGLYRIGYGDLDPEDAVWVAESLKELLSTGSGMDNL